MHTMNSEQREATRMWNELKSQKSDSAWDDDLTWSINDDRWLLGLLVIAVVGIVVVISIVAGYWVTRL